jgi:hypothetical protein
MRYPDHKLVRVVPPLSARVALYTHLTPFDISVEIISITALFLHTHRYPPSLSSLHFHTHAFVLLGNSRP